MQFLNNILDVVLGPLLLLPPFWATLVLSLLVSILTIVIYKLFTNQDLMKQLKDEMKAFQKDIKELKDRPEKALEVQRKAMETNMKYMTQSMKPTLITFIPIILLFGWVQAHLAYEPINPAQEFILTVELTESSQVSIETDKGLTVTGDSSKNSSDGNAIFTLKGDTGEHTATITAGVVSQTIPIKIEKGYSNINTAGRQAPIKQILVGNKKLIVMNLFGWKLGWLGTYIIFSIIFSMVLRKMLKVY